MRLSIDGLLPVYVNGVPSFLRWLCDRWGINTSGLVLAWSWVIWIRFMAGYASGYYPDLHPYYPAAFWWGMTNAEKSHNMRPWALCTEDDSYEV